MKESPRTHSPTRTTKWIGSCFFLGVQSVLFLCLLGWLTPSQANDVAACIAKNVGVENNAGIASNPPASLPEGYKKLATLSTVQRGIVSEMVSTQPDRAIFQARNTNGTGSFFVDSWVPRGQYDLNNRSLGSWRLKTPDTPGKTPTGLVQVEMYDYYSKSGELVRLYENTPTFTVFEPELADKLSRLNQAVERQEKLGNQSRGKDSKELQELSEQIKNLRAEIQFQMDAFFKNRVRDVIAGKARAIPFPVNASTQTVRPPASLPEGYKKLEALTTGQRGIVSEMVSTQPDRAIFRARDTNGTGSFFVDSWVPRGQYDLNNRSLGSWRLKTPDTPGKTPTGLVQVEMYDYYSKSGELVRLYENTPTFTVFEPELGDLLARLNQAASRQEKIPKDSKEYRELNGQIEDLRAEIQFQMDDFFKNRVRNAVEGRSPAIPH